MNKKETRANVKKHLESISELEVSQLSKLIGENLTTYLPRIISNNNQSPVHVIGGFSPIQKEVHWFESLFLKSQRIAVPHIIDEENMKFFEVGIDEVINQELDLSLTDAQQKLPCEPNLLLVPGLAFDKELNRLGRGRGYYDRYLKSFEGIKVGICFEKQIIETIPTEAFDMKLDYLITEKNIYTKGK